MKWLKLSVVVFTVFVAFSYTLAQELKEKPDKSHDYDKLSKLKILKEVSDKTALKNLVIFKADIETVTRQRNALVIGIFFLIIIFLIITLNKRSKLVPSLVASSAFASGDSPGNVLSDREREILQFLVGGLSYKQIAAECNISYSTVRFHMKNIYSKMKVRSMTEAVAKAVSSKWV